MTRDQMLAYLRAADEVAREAAGRGHYPFGCLLVGSDDRILMRQGNIDTVRHAETGSAGVPRRPIQRNSCGPARWSRPASPVPCAPVRSIGRISAAWSRYAAYVDQVHLPPT